MFNSPSIPEKLKTLILGLLWRIAVVGGSSTLIMRFGIVSWLKLQMAINNRYLHDLILLAVKLGETGDDVKVDDWNFDTYRAYLIELKKIRDQNRIY